MTNLFFSYSYRDETLRDELEIHLAALKRRGVLETWHDRRIIAGNDISNEISEHLEAADIILLLVSPYFIASEYCYGVEMNRAMQRHEDAISQVIPVILHPSDWQDLPFGKLLATPTDGKPVSKFPNQHDAFLEVTKAIRAAAEGLGTSELNTRQTATQNLSKTPEGNVVSRSQLDQKSYSRSSNLRIKKEFTDREKDQFLEEAFEYISNYFEESLTELELRNSEVETWFKRIDSNHFRATAYVNGTRAAGCRIWMGGLRSFTGGIAYSVNESGDDNSFNESLRIDDDGYSLFLSPLGMVIIGRRAGQEQLTNEGAAEYFWSIFIEPLQR